MGSVQNRIVETSFNETTLTADAKFSFTPGVNGDYAYPEASFVYFETKNLIQFDSKDMALEYSMTDTVEKEPSTGA